MFDLRIVSAIGILLAAVGLYFYIAHLKNENQKLEEKNAVLVQNNLNQKKIIEDTEKQTENINKVNDIGITVQIRDREKLSKDFNKVDESIRRNEDREVGPLLRDFLNGN
jgi:hypothetical protein